MKNLFGKRSEAKPQEQQEVIQPKTDKLTFVDHPKPPEEKQEVSPKKWKSGQFGSRNDLTQFLNDNGVDPEFIVPASNGQFNIFYKG